MPTTVSTQVPAMIYPAAEHIPPAVKAVLFGYVLLLAALIVSCVIITIGMLRRHDLRMSRLLWFTLIVIAPFLLFFNGYLLLATDYATFKVAWPFLPYVFPLPFLIYTWTENRRKQFWIVAVLTACIAVPSILVDVNTIRLLSNFLP